MFLEYSTEIHFDAKFKKFLKLRNRLLIKTPIMNERNCKINRKWNIAYNNGRCICAFAQIKMRLFNHNLNAKNKRQRVGSKIIF